MSNILEERWDYALGRVQHNPETGCMIWTGGKNRSGHGVMMIQGKRMYVHRIAYIVANGSIIEGSDIHHTCHNPSCVNPDHLKCLTKKEHKAEHIIYDRPSPAICKRGHTGKYKKNSQGAWICTECSRLADGRYYEKRTGKPRMWTFKKKTAKS